MPAGSEPLIVHGWTIYAHPLFLDRLEALAKTVERLREKHPEQYRRKNPTKQLLAIRNLILETIPTDPSRPEFRQGNTLGPDHTHWFRAKFFQQYRLFFRYHAGQRIIIYGWVNDDDTKRAYESKSDAYAVFRKMLNSGHPPDDWDALKTEALNEKERLAKLAGAPKS